MNEKLQEHWEKIYKTKLPNEVSWTQEKPESSIDFIKLFNLPKNAKIIDIGGGDSKLVDWLLNEGYHDITVLDISQASLERCKERLGENAKKVQWVVSDIRDFRPNDQYDLWHDRATFHFLKSAYDIDQYVKTVKNAVKGYLLVATFSKSGPEKCSGLDVSQYDQEELSNLFTSDFTKIKCINVDHTTPFSTLQNFTFCSFKKPAA